jgi:hypothetical protein
MDSMDNFRERFEALKQQTEQLKHETQALQAHTRAVERRLHMRLEVVMNKLALLLALLLAGELALTTSQASATTFIVTNVNDSGVGSLRQAILDANTTPGLDIILFDSALSGQTIVLATGALSIADDLAIIGLGAFALTVDGNGADVFRIDTSGNTVVFTGITVTNGEDGIQISRGANDNIVTVTHSRIVRQASDDGLSIDGDRNTVIVTNTVFLGNEDNLAVEGNNNSVTVTESTSTLAREDGIEVDGNDNVVTVKNTTLNNNGLNPLDRDDGLDVDGARNVLHLEQVTFSGNGEDGLDIEGPNNRVTVNHSTITGNGRSGLLNQDETSTSTIVVYNSIAAGNTGPDTIVLRNEQGRLIGNFQSAGYNLVGNGAASALRRDNTIDDASLREEPASQVGFNGPGDQVGTATNPIDARLGPLEDNGGPTLTHTLLLGSPAINAGDPNFTPPPDFDQRGPGFPRVQDGRIDIGALEGVRRFNFCAPCQSSADPLGPCCLCFLGQEPAFPGNRICRGGIPPFLP